MLYKIFESITDVENDITCLRFLKEVDCKQIKNTSTLDKIYKIIDIQNFKTYSKVIVVTI